MDQETITFIVDHILISEVMLTVWVMVGALTLVLAIRTELYPLLVTAGGTVPVIIYYAYSALHLWHLTDQGHMYGRAAYISLALSLILTGHLMYQGMRYKDG